MASNLSWTVSMADKVSGVATKIGGNLTALSAKFKALDASSKASAPRAPSMGKTGANIAGGLFAQPKTTWISDLLTKLNSISPRAAAAGASLVGMAGRAQAAFARLGPTAQAAVGKAGAALKTVGSALGSLIAMAAKAALALAAIGIGLGIAAAKYIVDIQAFKQSTMFAFGQLLGGQSQAIAGWDKVRAAAIMTGTDLMETGASFNALLAQGFDMATVDLLFKRMADIKTLNPAANIEAMSRAIAKIRAQGTLQGDELQSLTEAGLSSKLIYEEIGKVIGKSAEEVKKLQGAGKIKSEDALKGIKNAMARQAGGKEPGMVASEAASKTLLGSFGRMQAIVQAFAADLNIDFSPVARFLGKIGEVLSGDTGKAFGKAIEGVFAALGQALDNVSKEDVKAFFESLTSVLSGVATTISAIASAWAWLDATNAKLSQMQASMGMVGTAASVLGATIWSSLSSVGNMLLETFLGPLFTIARAIYTVFAAIGSLAGIKLPDIPADMVQNSTTKAAEKKGDKSPETADEIVRRVTENKPPSTSPATNPDGTPASAGGGAPGSKPAAASTTKVDVTTKVLFDTPMLRSFVTEIVKSEMGAGADAPA